MKYNVVECNLFSTKGINVFFTVSIIYFSLFSTYDKSKLKSPITFRMEVRILRHNYLPSLYRQSTEKLPSTKLRREMSATLTKVLSEESMPSEHARQQFRDCMENLFQFTSKKNPFGIECTEHPIYAGDVTPWAPYDKTIPCYLFPMSLGKLTAEFLEPGYFIIPLPPPPKKSKICKS